MNSASMNLKFAEHSKPSIVKKWLAGLTLQGFPRAKAY